MKYEDQFTIEVIENGIVLEYEAPNDWGKAAKYKRFYSSISEAIERIIIDNIKEQEKDMRQHIEPHGPFRLSFSLIEPPTVETKGP